MRIVYNTFTDDLDYVGDSGGPGGFVETLTPNSGGAVIAVADNINVQGLAANSGANAFPVYTYNGGAGQFNIENRAYLSPYVVDPSTTDGSKGTFTTLGAAITQAIADGATGNGVTIFVRDVTINETITVSTNSVDITISSISSINNQNLVPSNPVFSGSFTNSGSGAIAFNGWNISGTITNSGSGSININNSNISGTIANSSSGGIGCTNCFGNVLTANISHGELEFDQCGLSGGTITLSNDAGLALYYTKFSGTLAGSTSNGVAINNCYLPLIANNMTGGFISVHDTGFGSFNFFGNTNVSYRLIQSTQGNILQSVRSSTSYTVLNSDSYIGITSTSAPRTVTLPNSGVIKNQTFIIKDESGGAATNNITVSVAGGVKTIDGSTSYVINTDYGEVGLTYDGTNFFTITQINNVSSGNFLQVANNLSDVASQSTALNNIMPPSAAKGTLAVFNGTDWVNLGVGTDTYVLTANSGASDGVDWEAPGGGGFGSPTYFQAYKSAPTTVNAAVTNTVIFDTTTSNVGGAYNTSTGIFTAPATGFYGFSCELFLLGISAATPKVNNGYIATGQSATQNLFGSEAYSVTQEFISSFSWQMPMTAGDTVYITSEADGTGTYQLYGAATIAQYQCMFSGYRIA
jgi:hypothetical protein